MCCDYLLLYFYKYIVLQKLFVSSFFEEGQDGFLIRFSYRASVNNSCFGLRLTELLNNILASIPFVYEKLFFFSKNLLCFGKNWFRQKYFFYVSKHFLLFLLCFGWREEAKLVIAEFIFCLRQWKGLRQGLQNWN